MPKFKFNQTHNFNWYTVVWIAAFLLAIYLFNVWHINKSYFGIVENKSHLIGAQESGKVHKLLVTVGEQVKQDQVLAVLDISDLKTGLNQLREELTNIQKLEGAHALDRLSVISVHAVHPVTPRPPRNGPLNGPLLQRRSALPRLGAIWRSGAGSNHGWW